MEVVQPKRYTEEDYYKLPEEIRAELIDGQFYYMAAPSRMHQKILMELSGTIRDYIRLGKSSCEVYPAPFAVKLFQEKSTIVEPDISVICDADKLTDQGCTGVPDWIVEIVSPSTSSHDYIRKLYCRPPGFTVMPPGKYLAGGLQPGCTANLTSAQFKFICGCGGAGILGHQSQE